MTKGQGMETPLKKYLKYLLLLSIIVAAAIAFWIAVQIKPTKLTKEILESEAFKTAMTKRFKDLSGLDLRFDSLISPNDQEFEIKNLSFSGKDHLSPQCSITMLTGKISTSWKMADINDLTLSNLSCDLPLTQDGYLLGVKRDYTPKLQDLRALFGLSLKHVKINDIEIDAKIISEKQLVREISFKNFGFIFDLDLKPYQQDIEGTLTSNSRGGLITLKENNLQTGSAKVLGKSFLNLSSSRKSKIKLDFNLIEQTFLPSLDTKNHPATIFSNVEIEYLDKIDIKSLKIKLEGFGEIDTKGDIISSPDFSKIKGSLYNLNLKTHKDIVAFFGTDIKQTPLISITDSNATFMFDGHSENYDVEVGLSAPRIESLDKQVIALNSNISAKLDSKPGFNNIPFYLDAQTESLSIEKNEIFIHNLNLTSQGSIKNTTTISLDKLHINARDNESNLMIAGYLDINLNQPEFNLTGIYKQQLSSFYFGDAQVQGTTQINFNIETLSSGHFLHKIKVQGDIEKIKHPNLELEDVTFNIPLNAKQLGVYNIAHIINMDYNAIEQEFLNVFDTFNWELTGEIGKAKLIPDPSENLNPVIIPKIKLQNKYKVTKEKTTPFYGSCTFNTASSLEKDGTLTNWINQPTHLTWEVIALKNSPALNIIASPVTGKSSSSPRIDTFLQRFGDTLSVDYHIRGKWVKDIEKNSTNELKSSGNLKLPEFFKDLKI